MDHLLSQLEERFGDDQQHVVHGLNLVPSIMKDSSSRWRENVMDIATIYRDDLPMADNLDIELMYLETKWRDHACDYQASPVRPWLVVLIHFSPIFTPFFELFVLYL